MTLKKCLECYFFIFVYTSILFIQSTGILFEGDTCETPDGKLGVCTILRECNSVFELFKSGRPPLGSYVHCSFKGKNEIVCCEDIAPTRFNDRGHKDRIFVPDIPTTTTELPLRGESRSSEIACDRYYEDYVVPIDFHIVGGMPTAIGEFPHMAALAYPSTTPDQVIFRCGASLISENFVVTAAHCVLGDNNRPVFVRLGKISLRDAIDEASPIDVGITDIILHPTYNSSRIYNDIALLRLNTTLTITDNVRPACLYSDRSPIDQAINLTATGWGQIRRENRSRSDILLKVNLGIVDIVQCNASYMDGNVDRRVRDGIIEEQICAYSDDGDTCDGDSGGPLQIVGSDKRSVLVGIISVGISCASSIPGIYTSVAHYLEWIESIVW